MIEINGLAPDQTIADAYAEARTLAGLEAVFYKPDAKPMPGEAERAIAKAANDIAYNLRDSIYYIDLFNNYYRIRNTMLAKWSELPLETRMALREMMVATEKSRRLFAALRLQEQTALLEAIATISTTALQLFTFSTRINAMMADDIKTKVESDSQLRAAPTSDAVWDTITQLFPNAEEALARPLDRTKYVDRDLRKTPRLATD